MSEMQDMTVEGLRASLFRCWMGRKRLLTLAMGSLPQVAARPMPGMKDAAEEAAFLAAGAGNVARLCLEVWEARRRGELTRDAVMLTQMLYVAAAADVARDGSHYDPEMDRRVQWLRVLISEIRAGERNPRADADLEEIVRLVLHGPEVREAAGKELAAGVERDAER